MVRGLGLGGTDAVLRAQKEMFQEARPGVDTFPHTGTALGEGLGEEGERRLRRDHDCSTNSFQEHLCMIGTVTIFCLRCE